MFPIVHQILDNRNLAPGTYLLRDFVPNRDERDPSLTAKLSNYGTDVRSPDYLLRALVFGNESARIQGQVVVNQGGSKTFKQIEIRPFDTNFNFEHKTWNPFIEVPRELARFKYDPEKQGVSYGIQYRGPGPDRGTGRIYDPFTDSQLSAALRREFVYPGSGPSELLPSITGKPPLPYTNEHLQYLDQANGNNPQASASGAGALPARVVSPANRNSPGSDIADWIAGLAGVDPQNPTQPAPSQDGRPLGFFTNKPMPQWPVPPPIFGPR